MAEDADLVRKAQEGDTQALDTLLRRYQDRLFSFLLRMLGHRADAEDATEETFVRAIKSLRRYRERGQFKSWLYRIAYREGLRVLRTRRARSEDGDLALFDIPDPAQTPDQNVLSQDEVQRIEQAIGRLPPAEREVVALRIHTGLSFKEIAQVTDCSINTALGRMRNASRRLRQTLQRDEESHG